MFGSGKWASLIAVTIVSQITAADPYGDLITAQSRNQDLAEAIANFEAASGVVGPVRAFLASDDALQGLTRDLNNSSELSSGGSSQITAFYTNTYEPTVRNISTQLVNKIDLAKRTNTIPIFRRYLGYYQGNLTAAGTALTAKVALAAVRDACGTTEKIRRDLAPVIEMYTNPTYP